MLYDTIIDKKIPIFFPFYVEELTPEDSLNFENTKIKTDFGAVNIEKQLGASHRELLMNFLQENKENLYSHGGKMSLKININREILGTIDALHEAVFFIENDSDADFSFRAIDSFKTLLNGDSSYTAYIIFSDFITHIVENNKLGNLSFVNVGE